MEASELRIGNWVEIKKVKEVVYTTIQPSCFSTNIEKHYKSIPLSEEWLLKFGFKRGKLNNLLFNKKYGIGMKFTVFSSENFEIFKINKIPFYFIFNNVPHGICNLHEMQNLYFLITGEELILNQSK